MDRGWVKLWRMSVNSEVFQNEGLWKCWTWCLMKAAHAEVRLPATTGRGSTTVTLLPGQFIFGRKSAAKELGMPESTVFKRFAKLVAMQMLTQCELPNYYSKGGSKRNRHFTLYSIVNWHTYQGEPEKRNTQGSRQGTGKEHIQEHKNNRITTCQFSGEFFAVTEKQHQKYGAAYPGLDLLGEYRKMESWLETHPTKRKTERGYPAFVNRWLAKEFEKAKSKQKGNWFDKYPDLNDPNFNAFG